MPLGISHSSMELLRACPRKFEIYKMLQSQKDSADDIHSICGKSFGIGMQEWLKTGKVEAGIWEAYKIWNQGLGLEMEDKKKSFWKVINHIQKLPYTWKERQELNGWELVYFQHPTRGRIPTCELSFQIILSENFVWRGFIDAVLQHPLSGEYAVLENKTTGWNTLHPAQWQNSNQGASYAAVLDKILGIRTYNVKYFIAQFPSLHQEVYNFPKSEASRLEWIADMSLECQRIETYRAARHFPKHGQNCFNYNRPCGYFGVCELPKHVIGKYDIAKADYVEPAEDKFQYDYTFTIEELLERENLRG